MKYLLLLLFPCLFLSQNNLATDTIGVSPKVKEVTQKILMDNQVFEDKSQELNQELQKQVELMKQIKSKIAKIRTANEFSKNSHNVKNSTYIVKKTNETKAVKNEDVYIEYDGKRVMWEPRPRTWFGRIFNEDDIVYYPYIIGNDGNQIYIKL